MVIFMFVANGVCLFLPWESYVSAQNFVDKIRNSNIEIRNKYQGPNKKPWKIGNSLLAVFEFYISNLFRISTFVFRVWRNLEQNFASVLAGLRVCARITSPVWASIHPVWQRCSSFPYRGVCAVLAPCQTGVSAPKQGKLFLREP